MKSQLIEKIRNAVIGDQQSITTSFGEKPLVYADYTASGRALDFIEDYLQRNVLPYYANTHTEASYTGAQTTALREQSRQIIRQAVMGSAEDKVIFCGSGATAAINKLIDILNLRLPADLAKRHRLLDNIPEQHRPLVLIGPYEHHSNELPWRESIADVEVIPLNREGQLDVDVLQQRLEENGARELIIGSFSAASNVTGIRTDVDSISALLHEHGALAFWDYAAAAPYVRINMNGASEPGSSIRGDCSKDAVFISPHKFIGGPGTPGLLIIKQQLLKNTVPSTPGGGTVLYVTPEDHRFIQDPERREEGGTPAIVESIRAGLVFKLQQEVGLDLIAAREHDFISRALATWKNCDNIEILGSETAQRLSIVSLSIKHHDRDLHYGFVVALLNDLFGIQARGGCSCAGPYGHNLLGMDMAYSKALEAEIAKGNLVLRPGWIRLSFNYFIDEATFQYLLHAVQLVAENGWRLLPFYHFDENSGTWLYQKRKAVLRNNLADVNFANSDDSCSASYDTASLPQYLATASQELLDPDPDAKRYSLSLPESAESLRWFVLPQEIGLPPQLKRVG